MSPKPLMELRPVSHTTPESTIKIEAPKITTQNDLI